VSDEKKYVVPEGMRLAQKKGIFSAIQDAGNGAVLNQDDVDRRGLESAIAWRAENPTRPTLEFCKEMIRNSQALGDADIAALYQFMTTVIIEWQRRMDLAPEVEFSSEIVDLLVSDCAIIETDSSTINRRVQEAYRRGKEAGKK
jgi:hypothetical protein